MASAPLPAAVTPFEVVLINPYELGRQPFALAQPAAILKRASFAVACLDLSLQKLDPETLGNARLVAIHVGMHTGTRIAIEALPRIRALAPAHEAAQRPASQVPSELGSAIPRLCEPWNCCAEPTGQQLQSF